MSKAHWLPFWAQVWDPVLAPVLAPVLSNHTYRAQNGGQNWSQNWVPKLGPKPGPKIATNFTNFFKHFSGMPQIFARYGAARVLQLSHFLARVLACVLRRLTTSSYLGGSLNGSHILRAFQVLKFGPPFSCNMLRATRRHAIDGEEIQGPRAGEAKMKTGQNPSVKEQKHAKPNSPRLHNIKFAHICLDMKNIGFTATSEA